MDLDFFQSNYTISNAISTRFHPNPNSISKITMSHKKDAWSIPHNMNMIN
jgi:hypothetical protein